MRWAVVGVLALSACGGGDRPGPDESAQQAVPAEFGAACGKPGARVDVRSVPVTVRRADCDLRGVTLTHKGAGAVVPSASGESVSIFQDAPGGLSQSASVSVDETTGDVTFTYRAP